MSKFVKQIVEMSDFRLLIKELELGLVDKLFVTIDGATAAIPREALCYAYTHEGEYILFGDFCSIGEHEIELTLTNDQTDAVTIMTASGQVVLIEPERAIFISENPLSVSPI